MPTHPPRKRSTNAEAPGEQEIRSQEVLRANKELAAYFKGQRTEREARAALKIIKAFIRDRERIDPASRPPLPGAGKSAAREGRPTAVKKTRRPPIRHREDRTPKSARAEEAGAQPDATEDRLTGARSV
jgi:hypothetical protein